MTLLLVIPFISYSQHTEIEPVKEVVTTLFQGMYNGDSSLVHSAFSDDVRMYTTMKTPDGKEVLKQGGLEGFLQAVGTPHDQIWDEKISNLKVDVDGGLAHAWMDYEFYLGDKFSHCGVNAMQLVRIAGKWKIIHLIDTRKKAECEAMKK